MSVIVDNLFFGDDSLVCKLNRGTQIREVAEQKELSALHSPETDGSRHVEIILGW
jgi:hypothetical protein